MPESLIPHGGRRTTLTQRYSVRLVRGEHKNYFYPDFLVCLEHYPGDGPLQRLPAERVRQLLAHDMVPLAHAQQSKSHQAGMKWRIDALGLAAMSQVDRDPRVHSTADTVALKKFAREWHLSGPEFCALVHAVQTRSLDASGPSLNTPLGNKLVDKDAARTLTAILRRNHEGWSSVDQAAQALKIKQQVAYQLVKAGLLASAPAATRRRKVRGDAVDQFRNDYVALAELAKLRGRSPKVCLSQIQAKPVCGPRIDGIRQYFYLRKEAPTLHPGVLAPAENLTGHF